MRSYETSMRRGDTSRIRRLLTRARQAFQSGWLISLLLQIRSIPSDLYPRVKVQLSPRRVRLGTARD